MTTHSRCLALVGLVLGVTLPIAARATESDGGGNPDAGQETASLSRQIPKLAYAHQAFVGTSGSVGAAGFGALRTQGEPGSKPWLGGGVRAWGVPFERLALLAEAQRRENGAFAPSVGAMFQVAGAPRKHYAVGVLGQYLADGFAELGGEVELGVLMSYATQRLHLDANTVVGAGFEEGEADAELLGRFGYDVVSSFRIGGEGRFRKRISGSKELAPGRGWDGFVGAQALLTYDPVFFSVTGGPSNLGVTSGLGWSVLAALGGAMF